MGLIPSTLCKAYHTYIWHACTNVLDDPQGHLVHLALVYGQLSHLCGKIIKKNFKPYFFYLTILELLDITSQRKLAHIQRLILLNCHFNSISDTPVGTYPLAICDQSVLLVRTLFYFIFAFFQNSC